MCRILSTLPGSIHFPKKLQSNRLLESFLIQTSDPAGKIDATLISRLVGIEINVGHYDVDPRFVECPKGQIEALGADYSEAIVL